jgi:hypothetical protein
MLFGYLTHKSEGDVYCPPAGGLSREQAQLVVEKFMNEHPELLHEKAAVVAVAALRSAFSLQTLKLGHHQPAHIPVRKRLRA